MKKRKKSELVDLDRRMLAKIEELGGPLSSEELDRRMLAKIAELEARNAEKRRASG
jgi:hypothetical protein